MQVRKTKNRSGKAIAFLKCNFLEKLVIDHKIRQGKSPNIFSAHGHPGPKGKRYDYIVTSKVHAKRLLACYDPDVTGPQRFGIQPKPESVLDYCSDNIRKALTAIECQVLFPTEPLLKNFEHGFVIKLEVSLDIALTLRERAKIQRVYEDAGWTMAHFENGKFVLSYVEIKAENKEETPSE